MRRRVCKYARSHGDQIILALHGESWLGGGDSPLAQIANQLEEYPSFENLRKMETEVKGKLYDRRNGIETEVADFLQYFGENGAITLKGLTAQELKRQRSLEGWINCLESFGNPELFESVKESSYARKEGIVPVLRARELSSYVDATRDRMYIIEFDFLMHNRDIDANAASFATRMDAQRKQINALFQQDYQGPIRDSGSGEVMVKSSDVLGYVKERAVKALTFPEIGPVGFYARHSSEVFATLSVRPDAEHPLRRIELAPIRS